MIAIASDHAGYMLKAAAADLLTRMGRDFIDLGCTGPDDRTDYPDMAETACLRVTGGECETALLFCGTGIGISMAANKIPGIRAACCSDTFSARYTRMHNDANVLCMGGRVVGPGLAEELITAFLTAEFEGGRHAARVEKLNNLDNLK